MIKGLIKNNMQDISLEQQINNLAPYIMENIDGEPSQSERAIETAIRLLKTQKEELQHFAEWAQGLIDSENIDDFSCCVAELEPLIEKYTNEEQGEWHKSI